MTHSDSIKMGAILAGGASRRMGRPKEGIRLWDARPMMAHVTDVMRAVCEHTVVLGHCRGFELPLDGRLSRLEDFHPGHGPLSALETLLSYGQNRHYLVVACDQPLLTPSLLKRLLHADTKSLCFFRAESPEKNELDPFPGLYPAWFLPFVRDAIQRRDYSLRRLIRHHPIHWLPLPECEMRYLSNVNTPADVTRINCMAIETAGPLSA